MKKLSLKKLNLESKDVIQKEQLKTVFGGSGDCTSVYNFCDSEYPNDYNAFNQCMMRAGC